MRVASLAGSRAGGRWGPAELFPVIYLGRPEESIVVEAYRHLVDGTEGMTGDRVAPRRVWVCDVQVTNVLDLRSSENLEILGVTPADLESSPDDYVVCNEVAVAAHQLEVHGVLAPAATRLGETLALFEQHLSLDEYPRVFSQDVWPSLPDDPRSTLALRHVDES
jgi:RES domain-containing protein